MYTVRSQSAKTSLTSFFVIATRFPEVSSDFWPKIRGHLFSFNLLGFDRDSSEGPLPWTLSAGPCGMQYCKHWGDTWCDHVQCSNRFVYCLCFVVHFFCSMAFTILLWCLMLLGSVAAENLTHKQIGFITLDWTPKQMVCHESKSKAGLDRAQIWRTGASQVSIFFDSHQKGQLFVDHFKC